MTRQEAMLTCIREAELCLGRLTTGQRADLLMDNFPGIRDFAEATELVYQLETKIKEEKNGK